MSLKSLQEKIGVSADGAFGPGTMKKAMEFYKLTPVRAAHFFAQTAHETGGFKAFSENLNYSAKGLQGIFGKYFPGNLEESYARQPEKIANRVYASRMGNGDEASGDGWKYRGRGALQLTGKSNYQAFADYLKKPEILTTPDLVATTYAFESAMFFFDRNKLWTICDQGINDAAILALTKRINGGTHGLDDRKVKTYKYYEYVKWTKMSCYTREQIEAAVKAKGYVWFEGAKDFDVNIVGIRNSSTGDKVTNVFDDCITVSYKENGEWKSHCWLATTDPGKKGVQQYHNAAGVARLVEGQYRGSHTLGLHQGKYEALKQAKPVKVYRDANRDLTYDETKIAEGVFGINIHKAGADSTYVENWSEGCQVFKKAADFESFMVICRKAAAIHGKSFTYTLIESADIK